MKQHRRSQWTWAEAVAHDLAVWRKALAFQAVDKDVITETFSLHVARCGLPAQRCVIHNGPDDSLRRLSSLSEKAYMTDSAATWVLNADMSRYASWTDACNLVRGAFEDDITKAIIEGELGRENIRGFDIDWAAASYTVWEYMLAVRPPLNPWRPLIKAFAAGAFLFWIEQDVHVLLRPQIHLDDHGVLHCEDGPAIYWPDGTSLWFYKGIRVTEQIIMRPQTLTAKQILRQKNIEVRRAMIERYGIEPLLREVHAEKLDESAQGTLYRLELPGDELTVVEVVCPSTGRKYFLCVPGWLQTVRQAVAWTFGLSAEQYEPVSET
ncbi:hypothetical protein LM604_02830 [Candidatus Acetothermia bacterium]|jgi:hypothetical protein|nr:hypothetical protein [Candidatus Acetothermia bacterium]